MSRKLANGLTEQRKAFCDYYRADPERNAGKAYKTAYPRCSAATAETEGPALLRNPQIIEYLDSKAEKAEKKADITEERILTEVARLAFFNPRCVEGITKISELTEEQSAALSGIEYDDKGGIKKLKWHDKKSSLELLGRSRTIKAWLDRSETEHTIKNESDEELDARIANLLGAAGASGTAGRAGTPGK